MRRLVQLAKVTTLLAAGFLAGAIMTDDPAPPPPPKPIIKTVPKYIEHRTEVQVKVRPDSCRALVDAAEKSDAAIARYEQSLGALPQLLDDAYRGIYNKDTAFLNELKQKEITLEQQSIQALLDVRAARESITRLKPQCNKDMRK